jgi:amino acid transporter
MLFKVGVYVYISRLALAARYGDNSVVLLWSAAASGSRGLRTPSMAGVMAALVGPWGAAFISIGLLISVLGNDLSWSLLARRGLIFRGTPDDAQLLGAADIRTKPRWDIESSVDASSQ